jgi:hypothetical protein
MLLNTKQDEEANGAAAVSNDGQCVGRLVMRGKTCEVKAAEPKDASRSARRGYQNPGFGAGNPNRRFGDKAYGERPVNAPHLGAYHDPHYMAGHGHQYPMMSPPYYPAYHHPGFYHAGGGYHPGPFYPPVQSGDRQQPAVPTQPIVPPSVASHVEATQYPYMDPSQLEVGTGHHYAYEQPQIYPAYPLHAEAHVHAKGQQFAGPYAMPGPSSSVMHPAAPGIPSKEDK